MSKIISNNSYKIILKGVVMTPSKIKWLLKNFPDDMDFIKIEEQRLNKAESKSSNAKSNAETVLDSNVESKQLDSSLDCKDSNITSKQDFINESYTPQEIKEMWCDIKYSKFDYLLHLEWILEAIYRVFSSVEKLLEQIKVSKEVFDCIILKHYEEIADSLNLWGDDNTKAEVCSFFLNQFKRYYIEGGGYSIDERGYYVIRKDKEEGYSKEEIDEVFEDIEYMHWCYEWILCVIEEEFCSVDNLLDIINVDRDIFDRIIKENYDEIVNRIYIDDKNFFLNDFKKNFIDKKW